MRVCRPHEDQVDILPSAPSMAPAEAKSTRVPSPLEFARCTIHRPSNTSLSSEYECEVRTHMSSRFTKKSLVSISGRFGEEHNTENFQSCHLGHAYPQMREVQSQEQSTYNSCAPINQQFPPQGCPAYLVLRSLRNPSATGSSTANEFTSVSSSTCIPGLVPAQTEQLYRDQHSWRPARYLRIHPKRSSRQAKPCSTLTLAL